MPPVNHIAPGPDTIRILLTTDNHVGYNENDAIRGDDSWKTFHEITRLAKTHDVDMIVQGGDMFHVNKPSKKLLYHVMKALRLNCLGDRPCELELLSDPALLLDGGFNSVNYEDPNINVLVPVFAISGNHDDATGEGLLLPMDVLAVAGLVNHFGKIPDNEKITVSPILFQKGSSKLALYGMNNVKDERLMRVFRDSNVRFLRPNVYTDEWFNMLCVHQNHVQHSMTAFLPENFLPNFLQFVLWGHEHECLPFPAYNPDTGFDTLQPGSSVATSLSEGEAAQKHVFIMNIKGKDYSIEPIKLTTVRPFVMKEVSLQQCGFLPGPASKDDISAFLTEEVEKLIHEAKVQYKAANPDLFDSRSDDTEEEDKKIPLPLVRLRVEHSGDYEVENPRRFSNRFVGRLANVNDVLSYHKRRGATSRATAVIPDTPYEGNREPEHDKVEVVDIQQLMTEFLQESQMHLIPEDGINELVLRVIQQDDKQILTDFIERTIANSTKLLLSVELDEEEFHTKDEKDMKSAFKNVLSELWRGQKLDADWKPKSTSPAPKKAVKPAVSKAIVSDDLDIEIQEAPKAKPRPKRAPRAKKNVSYQEEHQSGDEEDYRALSDGEDMALLASSDDEVMEVQPTRSNVRSKTNQAKESRKTPKKTASKIQPRQSAVHRAKKPSGDVFDFLD